MLVKFQLCVIGQQVRCSVGLVYLFVNYINTSNITACKIKYHKSVNSCKKINQPVVYFTHNMNKEKKRVGSRTVTKWLFIDLSV